MKPLTRHLLVWTPIVFGFLLLYFTYGVLPFFGILLVGFGLGQMLEIILQDDSSESPEENLPPKDENKNLNNSSSK